MAGKRPDPCIVCGSSGSIVRASAAHDGQPARTLSLCCGHEYVCGEHLCDPCDVCDVS